jgi:hypothetical protein
MLILVYVKSHLILFISVSIPEYAEVKDDSSIELYQLLPLRP